MKQRLIKECKIKYQRIGNSIELGYLHSEVKKILEVESRLLASECYPCDHRQAVTILCPNYFICRMRQLIQVVEVYSKFRVLGFCENSQRDD